MLLVLADRGLVLLDALTQIADARGNLANDVVGLLGGRIQFARDSEYVLRRSVDLSKPTRVAQSGFGLEVIDGGFQSFDGVVDLRAVCVSLKG